MAVSLMSGVAFAVGIFGGTTVGGTFIGENEGTTRPIPAPVMAVDMDFRRLR